MTVRKSPDEHLPGDDTALLIAALDHARAWYEARVDRGLQVVNYFIVASAVLATAYATAINGKHNAIAAVIGLAEALLTAVAFAIGRRQRHLAAVAEPALAELQDRIADRLKVESFHMAEPLGRVRSYPSVRIAFGLALLFSICSVLYALIH